MADEALLLFKTAFFSYMGQCHSGTATGGSASKLTDTALKDLGDAEFPFPLENRQLRITKGLADGNLRRVAKALKEEGSLIPNVAFSAAVASTDTYQVWGNAIHAGQPLTDLFNDALSGFRYLDRSKVAILDGRGTYDCSSLVRVPDEVVEVYLRRMDPTGKGPYAEVAIDSWQTRIAYVVDTATITITGTPTAGHYHILYGVQVSDELAYNAAQAAVQAALRELVALETATVLSAGVSPNLTHTATLPTGALETPLAVDASALTGGAIAVATATSSRAVLLDIYPTQGAVGAPHVQTTELWVEHWKPFTAFSTDASTMDGLYKEWLAWEAVWELSRRKVALGTDVKRWEALAKRARNEALARRDYHFRQKSYRANHGWYFQGR